MHCTKTKPVTIRLLVYMIVGFITIWTGCNKTFLQNCSDVGVCVQIHNLSPHDITSFTIDGIIFEHISAGEKSSRQNISRLHSHNNLVSFTADGVSFATNWVVCGTGFEEFTSGAFTLHLTISDFERGYFSVELEEGG